MVLTDRYLPKAGQNSTDQWIVSPAGVELHFVYAEHMYTSLFQFDALLYEAEMESWTWCKFRIYAYH